jgi:hypothetical protein
MTTQPPDLKKLVELLDRGFSNLPDHRDSLGEDRIVGFCIRPSDEAYGKHGLSEPVEWLRSTLKNLLDAYEASARDAERYRWIRNTMDGSVEASILERDLGDVFVRANDDLDQAIDAVRHATQGD